jgi:hypothetical protein
MQPDGGVVTGERIIGAGIALLLILALGVVGLNLMGAEPGAEDTEALANLQTSGVNPLTQLFQWGDVEPVTATVWTDAVAPAESPLPAGYVQVCGVGAVPAAQHGASDAAGLAGVAADARVITHARLRKIFMAHSSERVRAASLVLDLAMARQEAAATARARHGACGASDRASRRPWMRWA